MCGRFTNRMTWREIAELYVLLVYPQDETSPRYNAAPTQQLPIVLGEQSRGEMMRWAIQGPKGPIFNARSETVHRLPTFRDAFKRRRCLVPADGFYEWRTEGTEKYPYWFTLADGGPCAFAGIYNEGEGFCLMTTTPNAVYRPCTIACR